MPRITRLPEDTTLLLTDTIVIVSEGQTRRVTLGEVVSDVVVPAVAPGPLISEQSGNALSAGSDGGVFLSSDVLGGGGGGGAVISVAGKTGAVTLAPGDVGAAAAIHSHGDATTAAAGFMSAADKTKLDGVATGATANSADSVLLDRTSHTGTQPTSTVDGLDAALAGKMANSAAGLAGLATTTAADGTHGPTLGAAAAQANAAQAKATIFTQENALLEKQELVGFRLPYEDGVFPSIAAGDVLTVGASLGSHIYGVSMVSTETLDTIPHCFMISNGDGLVENQTFAQSWIKMQSGRPFTPRSVAPVSNILSFDARDGRNILVPTLAANATIAASCWDHILDHEEPVTLIVAIGATPYSLTPTPGDDGLRPSSAPSHQPNTLVKYEMSRINGVPSWTWIAEYPSASVAAPTVSYVGVASNTNINAAWSLGLPAGAAEGDAIVVIQDAPGSSSLAGLPTLGGVNLTDSGATHVAQAPSIRTSYRMSLTSGDIAAGSVSGASFAGAVYILLFRKSGGGITIGTVIHDKGTSSADNTIDWAADGTPAQSYILGAFVGFLSTDDASPPLRAECTVVASRASGSSRSYIGVSALRNYPTDTIAYASTTKTSSLGRWGNSQFWVA